MSVLIGGSGSTGSTLVRKILNNHKDIFSGPELNLFSKEQLFDNWNKEKKFLLKHSRSFSTKGWSHATSSHILRKEYGWNAKSLGNILEKTNSLVQFADIYFSKPLNKYNKKIWIEKTPANCYSFQYFLNNFQDSRVISTVRNPLDTITSLIKRGLTPYAATGVWVYNTACAINIEDKDLNYILKYENFISNPEKEMRAILNFLGLEYYNEILNSNLQRSGNIISSWNNSPSDKINNKNKNTFKKLDNKLQREILTALSMFKISPVHINKRKLKYSTAIKICDFLNYNFNFFIDQKSRKKIKLDMYKDYLYRIFKLNRTMAKNYPAILIE